MSELSPRGRDLLRASRDALRPQVGDRERVLGSVRKQLGAPVSGVAHKLTAVAQSSRASWTVAAAALIGVGGAIAIGMSSTPKPVKLSVPTLASTVVPAASLAPLVGGAPPSVPAAVPPTVDSVAVPAPSVQSRHDRLAEEVAILSQAAKDLRAGRAANALSALNEHQKKFPNGLLAQERRAARAEALCSLGRYAEAQSELSTLSRTAPQSPLTVQAQARCRARPTQSR